MSSLSSKDRASLCTFTFADGRRCRTPRQSAHRQFCCFHARKQAQADAAEQLGRDFAYFFSGDYFSACDLAVVLGRLFAAVARGDIKPKAAATLAYLAQTLLLTIQAAEHEYISAFGRESWRDTVYTRVKENQSYGAHGPAESAPQPIRQPQLADQVPEPLAGNTSQSPSGRAPDPGTIDASSE